MGYGDGVGLYQFAISNPLPMVDPTGAAAWAVSYEAVGVPGACDDCEAAKRQAVDDPRYQNLVGNIQYNCPDCSPPPITCDSSGLGGCSGNNKGYTDSAGSCPTITICCGHNPDVPGYVETIIHELVHAWDFCAYETWPSNWDECRACVYTEIRANLAAGECLDRPPGALRCSCAGQRACQSCIDNEHCSGPVQCQAARRDVAPCACNQSPQPWVDPPPDDGPPPFTEHPCIGS